MIKRISTAITTTALATTILLGSTFAQGSSAQEVDAEEVRSLGSVQPIRIPAPAGPVIEDDPYIDQAARLYRAALGREGDAAGIAYWADRLREGYPLEEIARYFLDSEEGQLSSGDQILDAYRWALGREPESGGYAYWSQFSDTALAVSSVSDSVEHQVMTETIAPPPRVAPPSTSRYANGNPNIAGYPAGWVDAGHGVWVPQILISIRYCESKHDYTAQNRRSTASGGYQFLNSSWAAYGHSSRYGVSRSMYATPAQQDEAALITWQESGTRPWAASRSCWG